MDGMLTSGMSDRRADPIRIFTCGMNVLFDIVSSLTLLR